MVEIHFFHDDKIEINVGTEWNVKQKLPIERSDWYSNLRPLSPQKFDHTIKIAKKIAY